MGDPYEETTPIVDGRSPAISLMIKHPLFMAQWRVVYYRLDLTLFTLKASLANLQLRPLHLGSGIRISDGLA